MMMMTTMRMAKVCVRACRCVCVCVSVSVCVPTAIPRGVIFEMFTK